MTSLYRSSLYQLSLRGRDPRRIAMSLPISWPEDRQVASAIMEEAFLFAGRRYPLGRAPWAALFQSESMAAALHEFGWLASLRAVGSKAAQQRAKELVSEWIGHNRRWSTPAWRTDVLGRRLTMWLTAPDFLLADGDDVFRARFLNSLGMQARHLARVGGFYRRDAGAIAAAKGRLACALCIGVGRYQTAIDQLCRELDTQVLPDGGHIQRVPSLQLQVLRDLIDIRAMLQAAKQEVPQVLVSAIDRMAPMLRGLRLGDGTLALFNGGKEEDHLLVDAVLARAAVKGKAITNAPHVGFQRIAVGRTVVIMDAGSTSIVGEQAHAGALSFEMSVLRDRLVVNCGAHWGDDSKWRQAMKTTNAHSTLIVDDADSADTRPRDRRNGRAEVEAVRREDEDNVWLDVSHSGYRRQFKLVHRRRLYVTETGDDIRGEDTLEGPNSAPFKVRFHLHPHVQVSMVQDGSAVLMRTANGGGWRFISAGGTISLEDSVYLGASDTPRRTRQIVVSGAPQETGGQVKWAFRREGEP
ncbi:MAG: heparinase II/III family protein [Rhodospirillales bacterium]|nr:heparinase II/III family protein [Rhodospirillales bacterium]